MFPIRPDRLQHAISQALQAEARATYALPDDTHLFCTEHPLETT